LGVLAAFVVIAGAASYAPDRVLQQDQAGELRDLTLSYLEFEQTQAERHADDPIGFDPSSLADALPLSEGLAGLSDLDLSDLDAARTAGRERRCLSEAIYYEARSETVAGQMAVAEVVLNRMRHRAYPNTICGVVYQGSERRTGCQFTFTCDGSMASVPNGRGWERAQTVADHALMGFARPVTSRATHYHTTAVDPVWNDSLVRTRRIGSHIFYRFPNRSERRLLAEREA